MYKSAPQNISVLIADYHEIFLTGLSRLMHKMTYVTKICTAQNPPEILTVLDNMLFQVLIIDIHVDEQIIMLVKKIRRKYPKIKIIGLSIFNNTTAITSFMHAGGNAFLLKSTNLQEIDTCIRSVINGKDYLNEAVQNSINAYCWDDSFYLAEDTVKSKRLREMLYLIYRQLTSKQIAAQMELSTKTVEKYRKHLLKITGAKNAVGLAIYAMKHDIHIDHTLGQKYYDINVAKIS